MEWVELELDGQRSVKFVGKNLSVLPAATIAQRANTDENSFNADQLGGIFRQGTLAWLSQKNVLHIVSLRNGQLLCSYEFSEANGFDGYYIKCIEPLERNINEHSLLAVCLGSYFDTKDHISLVALFSVQHGFVLSCISLKLNISCCCFLNAKICRRALLKHFDGCLAVASEEGVIMLLDLNIAQLLDTQNQYAPADVFKTCRIVEFNLELQQLSCHFQQSRKDGEHFCIKMEVMEAPCAINSILPIELILGLAVGLEDGRMILYDLDEMQVFFVREPTQTFDRMPVLKMCYLLPNDDPHPCFYIWTVHGDGQCLWGFFHRMLYEQRVDDGQLFESFYSSQMCMVCSLDSAESVLVNCQPITRVAPLGSIEDSICLTAFTWYSPKINANKLLLFDVNQWYKDEMPRDCSARNGSHYLAGYKLDGRVKALHSHIIAATVTHFNSMQRYEEHFYPTAFSFDCMLLLNDDMRYYNCIGMQNRFIARLRTQTAAVFLEPDRCFEQILKCRLMPQFQQLNMKAVFSRKAKHDVLLSVALEHNCIRLLRDCIRCWSDGSFVGNVTASNGLSLSTLTDWIWNRASDIKTHCNDICRQLSAFNAYSLDERTKKEFGYLTRQLKLLSDLLGEVLKSAKQGMPEKVFNSLRTRHSTLSLAAEYQNIFLWLISIGLLPDNAYPHKQLQHLYASKRSCFAKINESLVSKKKGNCRLLYIDAFIEQSCKTDALREQWLECGGDGLYPPVSIDALLRIMLLPDLSYENKCAILLYSFLDLDMAMQEKIYKHVPDIGKFPSVFKLSASLIKTVQAFWNLDHGHFLCAVDEFVSPFTGSHNYQQWQLELLIETLLSHDYADLALRVLKAHADHISPVLRLKTMLANELIAEAFYFARSISHSNLLELFFSICLYSGKYSIVRDLALSDDEGQLLLQVLKKSKLNGAKSLHFVYLLQKNKYIEAVSYMDELSRGQSNLRLVGGNAVNNAHLETPNVVLSAFNTTMTPITQGLTDVYFRIKNKIKQKEMQNQTPVPLSCQLIKQNANNLLGGLYHSSALSAHFASYYWGNDEQQLSGQPQNLLSASNAPFLRKPQPDADLLHEWQQRQDICYPQPYKLNEKRKQSVSDGEELTGKQQQQENPKKRRRILAQEIVRELSHLQQPKVPRQHWQFAENVNKDDGNRNDDDTANSEASKSALLAQPLDPINSIVNSPACTRQGILKTTPMPEQTLRRSLHFSLSTVDNEKTAEMQQEQQPVKETINASSNPKRTYACTLSEDSNSSSSTCVAENNNFDTTMEQSSATDIFFSPTASQNEQEERSFINESFVSACNRQSIVSIAPRASLHSRSSSSREEKLNEVNEVLQEIQNDNRENLAKKSSGYGTLSNNESIAHLKTIEYGTTLSSNVTTFTSAEFQPQFCSSKVATTQSKFVLTRKRTCEYTTVLDCDDADEISASHEATTIDKEKLMTTETEIEIKRELEKKQQQQQQSLDSTLDMNSYELTTVETTQKPEANIRTDESESSSSDSSFSKRDAEVLSTVLLQVTQHANSIEAVNSEIVPNDENSRVDLQISELQMSAENSNEKHDNTTTIDIHEEDEDDNTDEEDDQNDNDGDDSGDDDDEEIVADSMTETIDNHEEDEDDNSDDDDEDEQNDNNDITEDDGSDIDIDDESSNTTDLITQEISSDGDEDFANQLEEIEEEIGSNSSSSSSSPMEVIDIESSDSSQQLASPTLSSGNQSNSENSMLVNLKNASTLPDIEVSTPSGVLSMQRQYKLFQDNNDLCMESPIVPFSRQAQQSQQSDEAANEVTIAVEAEESEVKLDAEPAVTINAEDTQKDSNFIEIEDEEESIIIMDDLGEDVKVQKIEQKHQITTEQGKPEIMEPQISKSCELVEINKADSPKNVANSEIADETIPTEICSPTKSEAMDAIANTNEQKLSKIDGSIKLKAVKVCLLKSDIACSPTTSRTGQERFKRKGRHLRGASVPTQSAQIDTRAEDYSAETNDKMEGKRRTQRSSSVDIPSAIALSDTNMREILTKKMEAINEEQLLDSPSTRTRARLRQSLAGSESVESVAVSDTDKRIRRPASTLSEPIAPSTPVNRRRYSKESSSEALSTPSTLRSLRSRKSSVNIANSASRAEQDDESITPVKGAFKRANSVERDLMLSHRRITRHELQMLQKNEERAKRGSDSVSYENVNNISILPKRRKADYREHSRDIGSPTRSVGSVASHHSQASVTSSSRIMTRSQTKQMLEKDDDSVSSLASSNITTRSHKRSHNADKLHASPLEPIDETEDDK